jgi:hypothetical protein
MKWLIGGTIVGLLGLSFYLTAVKRSSAPSAPADVVVRFEQPPVKPTSAPAVIQQVVDVADIDPLLDPPPTPPADSAVAGPILTRVGYQEAPPPKTFPTDVKPIPKATPDLAENAGETENEGSLTPLPR